MYEPDEFDSERKSKQVVDFHESLFYEEHLTAKADDRQKLEELFANAAALRSFSGEKKCGGFHADFALEWKRGADTFLALVCFGCSEVKLFGPGVESRHDLEKRTAENLKMLLKDFHKSRPVTDQYKNTFATP